jgi:hypothetical protein
MRHSELQPTHGSARYQGAPMVSRISAMGQLVEKPGRSLTRVSRPVPNGGPPVEQHLSNAQFSPINAPIPLGAVVRMDRLLPFLRRATPFGSVLSAVELCRRVLPPPSASLTGQPARRLSRTVQSRRYHPSGAAEECVGTRPRSVARTQAELEGIVGDCP